MKIIIPKELSPKSKLAFFEFKNIAYAIIMFFIVMQVRTILNLHGFIANLLPLYALFLAVLFLIPISKYGNTYNLLFNSIKFLDLKFRKKNYVYEQVGKIEKTVIKKDKTKIKTKIVKLNSSELKQQSLKKHQIQEIEGNLFKLINGKYITFLEVKISELPLFESDSSRNQSVEALHYLISSFENGRIFSRNIPFDFQKKIHEVDKKELEMPKFKDFFEMKKWQLKKAEEIYQIRYFIEIEANSISEINQKINICKNNNKIELDYISKNDLDFFIEEIKNNSDSKFYEDYIYNPINNTYESYLKLNKFEQIQNYYYLQKVFNTNFDCNIRFKNVVNDKYILDKATSEIESRLQYNKTRTTQNEVQQQLIFIDQLTQDLLNGNQKLIEFELTIKIEANSIENLKFMIQKVQNHLQNVGRFSNNYFKQKDYCLNFYDFATVKNGETEYNTMGNSYVISSQILSGGFMFDFTTFMQEGGLLKNATANSLLIYNPIQLNQKLGLSSYNKLILADSGGGKSTDIKQEALDTITFLNGKIIMFDFDGETQKLINYYNGDYIQMGNTNINLLKFFQNNEDDNVINNHIDDILSFFICFYPSLSKEESLELRQKLRDLYHVYHINQAKTKELITDFPILTDLLKMKYETKVIDIIKDFTLSYPFLSGCDDDCFKFENKLNSISFNLIKDNEKLLNGLLFWSTKAVNNTMRKNKGSNEFLRIIIDESHRVSEIPVALRFMLKMFKEARKYNSGITIVDHSPTKFFTDKDKQEIWELAVYKLFLKMEHTAVQFLKDKGILNDTQAKRIENPDKKGQGLLKIGNKVVDYHSEINEKFITVFDGGL